MDILKAAFPSFTKRGDAELDSLHAPRAKWHPLSAEAR
jgi:hypothetical protein